MLENIPENKTWEEKKYFYSKAYTKRSQAFSLRSLYLTFAPPLFSVMKKKNSKNWLRLPFTDQNQATVFKDLVRTAQ